MKTCLEHPNRKMQARGMCKPCYDRWLKEQNPGYRERQLSNTQRWAHANPDKWAALQERRRQKIACDPVERERVKVQARSNLLKRKYGITPDDYDRMLAEQNGGCAICRRAPGKRPLHVDHCHATGQVRGLLCHQCNWYLGTIEADVNVLPRLLTYLRSYKSPILKEVA